MSGNGILRVTFLVAGVGLLAAAVAEAANGPYNFYSVTPCRIVDTRKAAGVTGGPALSAGSERNFPISAAAAGCGLPSTATAATLNVTMVGPTKPGFLSFWAYNTTRPSPLVSTINYQAGQTRANNAVAKLGPSGDLSVKSDQGPGTTQFILDVNGYFQ